MVQRRVFLRRVGRHWRKRSAAIQGELDSGGGRPRLGGGGGGPAAGALPGVQLPALATLLDRPDATRWPTSVAAGVRHCQGVWRVVRREGCGFRQ